VLYLENHLAPGVFTPARIAVLQVLAPQAAMALENSRLYRDLELREARIRRLVDANIVDVAITRVDGSILDVNDAALKSSAIVASPCAGARVEAADYGSDHRRQDLSAVVESRRARCGTRAEGDSESLDQRNPCSRYHR
jgi:hypothetical protein